MNKNEKISEKLKGNKNAEKWTLEESENFLQKAVELSKNTKYDFEGEIAKDLDSYIEIFLYLIDKFPILKPYWTNIKRNCETNCFSNAKKEFINVSAAIMNLKSNHKWTDRNDTKIDHTSQGEKLATIQFVTTNESKD